MQEKDETRLAILQSADKHPNSRVSKLIRNVEADRSQKNIVLLLIELAEHTEYATDFSISLKYYLDLFERLGVGREIVLNEAGLLLLNSSKIYGRRVDYVHELVERQIITLSNADKEIDEAKNAQQSNAAPEKPKRSRKRLVEAPKDPYEIELIPKKFRKITNEKRFAINSNNNATLANKLKSAALTMRRNEAEQYIHPAGWTHAHIVDLENEEDIDSKRNYKLFTYHVEHRYNTLVADINFRLHFMVKDFIDAEEERMEEEEFGEQPTAWPPLSEAYVEQYLNLENRILHQSKENTLPPRQITEMQENAVNNLQKCALSSNGAELLTNGIENNTLPSTVTAEKEAVNCEHTQKNFETEDASVSFENDSALGESILDSTVEGSIRTNSILEGSISDSTVTAAVDNANINNLPLTEELAETFIEESSIEHDISASTNGENENNLNLTNAKEGSNQIVHNELELETSTNNANESQQNDSGLEKGLLDSFNSTKDSTTLGEDPDTTCQNSENLSSNSNVQNETVLSDSTVNLIKLKDCSEGYFSEEILLEEEDSAHNKSDSVLEKSFDDDNNINLKVPEIDKIDYDDTQINLGEIRIHLPHLDDEGVFFSDLDENEQRMLSPTVMALDVFPSLPNKQNLTVIVDDDIRAMLNIPDDEAETYELPVRQRPDSPPIQLNIMKIHEKFLKRRLLFKLGPEFDLYMQARMRKRRTAAEPKEHREPKQFKLCDMSGDRVSPSNNTCQTLISEFNGFNDDTNESEPDFLGFDENERTNIDNLAINHRLSRDSGVGADVPITPGCTSLETIFEENSSEENVAEICTNVLTEIVHQTSNREEENLNENENVETNKIDKSGESEASPKETEIQNEVQILNVSNEIVEQNLNSADITIPVVEHSVDLNTEIPFSQNLDDILEDPSDVDADNVFETEVELGNDSALYSMHEEVDLSADLDINSTKTKIQKWHEHLQPILAKSRERHHFDVFQIGTEIIDVFEDNNFNDDDLEMEKRISFQDVMENRDASYVSRYFLSSLLLANQSNIKISVNNKSSEQPSAWKDIQFQLLSTKRHTVSIEDNIGMVTKSNKLNAPQATTSNAAIRTKHKTKATNHTERFAVPPTVIAPIDISVVDDCPLVKVNLDVVKPFKQIAKLPCDGDDYDSGVFSSEEFLS